MIRPLRKRHLYIWVLLAILVPVIFGAVAFSDHSQPANENWHSQSKKQPQEQVLFQGEEEGVILKVLQVSGSPLRKLEFELWEPLTGTSALVYWVPQGEIVIEKGILLGQVGPRGVYTFPLDSIMSQQTKGAVALYDNIKKNKLRDFSVDIGE